MPLSTPLANASTNQIALLKPSLPTVDALLPYLHRIDATHWYSNYGPLWRQFRDQLTTRLGDSTSTSGVQVAFTANGTSAIELALRCRALPARRFCLMPSYTFIASAHAACNANLEPFLVDIDPHSLTLTPEIAEAALRVMPEPPAAVLVISAYGAPPNVAAWAAFEQTHGIPVVFDAAAALTSLDAIGMQPLCVSLHATKVLGIGEGGAVICTDAALIEQITAMTGFGFVGGTHTSAVRGGNYRISEYAAAVGLAALDGLDAKVARLRAVAEQYREGLKNSPIRLQDGAGEKFVTMTLNVVVPADALANVLGQLNRREVQWRRWWGLGCDTHPAFATLPTLALPVTRDLAPRVIGIPCHTTLTSADIAYICACLCGR